ncbi:MULTISPECIES: NAD(P)H-dependent oxidoreductase [unclassified Actinomyces]|uniref:NADPH-dependent FMN reductase n=1 Tax=unclassified Actinomyces TaxID=2609248 RepID=UPI002016F482|nr:MULTISPECIES: NAD(P)H-dependent oxidoreductase [unclassified Actinomyces]MCL3776848.1 NAD(P)H-dependent oxidoreductase [Actinomyces sp. AC-20-1]MCL3790597.1 NAD(P)H-dependent oxidoreductase [Actinomyces sp. 187325]MCL3792899.1 NAD(P)H-dependent oxidoreductase [Actinomyces sp. 186855]MCL3794651.1 NAD(P)H-dependent oxidoreductase [Actinomyces sp. 217892]
MTTIAVISGSVRPASVGGPVAQWVADKANAVEGVEATVLNLADFNLPVFVEDYPTAVRPATDPAAVRWNEALASYDAYVFVTPEYNHSIPGALKNAIDFITPSVLANKAVGLVSYSFGSGFRPIEALRLILANFTTGVVGPQVNLHLATDFENMSVFKPAAFHDAEVPAMVEAIVAQDRALSVLR